MTPQLDAIEDVHFPPFHKTVAFDVIFGIVGPILCLVLDPIVFHPSELVLGGPILGGVRILAYAAFVIQMTALAIWLAYRRQSPFLYGVLMSGACLSGIIGVVMIPLSLFATLFLGIGLLGFMPLVTAYVFRRNALAAWLPVANEADQRKRTVPALCGVLVSCAIPFVCQIVISSKLVHATQLALSNNTEEASHGITVIKRYRLLADLDSLVLAYGVESNNEKRARMAAVYEEIVGDDIQERLELLSD